MIHNALHSTINHVFLLFSKLGHPLWCTAHPGKFWLFCNSVQVLFRFTVHETKNPKEPIHHTNLSYVTKKSKSGFWRPSLIHHTNRKLGPIYQYTKKRTPNIETDHPIFNFVLFWNDFQIPLVILMAFK